MGGATGGGGGKGQNVIAGPGGLTGADVGLAEQALGLNEAAIHNRYQQLGLGTPSGGQTGAGAAAGGTNLTYGGPSTMEQQDIGTIPTESGGAIGQEGALLGQLFNPTNAAGLGPGGPISQLQQIAQQQQQAGFAAGSQGGTGGTSTGGGAGSFGQSTDSTG
ncbi:MAG TPA: hypothetical protein VHT52_01625 [Stellaceae bacterium]|nr:hypothetical protein [Stellaceae bacterium]